MKFKIMLLAMIMLISFLLTSAHASIQNEPRIIQIGVFAGSNWNVPNSDSYAILDNAIRRFEKQFPNIKVVYRSGTLKDDYSEWLAQKILTGDEPDIFIVIPEDFVLFSSIGVLKNLDKLIQNDNDFNKDAYYTTAMQAGEYIGNQFALPFETVPVLMFVNKTLLQTENIPIPKNDWTWNDFYDICDKVTRDINGDGILDQYGSYEFRWQDAVHTNSAVLFNAQGSKAFFNSNEVLDAIWFAKKVNSLSGNYRITSQDFDNGYVAFRPLPFSSYRAYKPYPYRIKKYSNFEWDCIKMPAGPNGDNASELHTLLYGMSNRTANEKEAWEFIKFLTSDVVTQLEIFRYSHGVSVIKTVTESEEASLILHEDIGIGENFINMKVLSEVIEQSIVPPKFPRYTGAMELADKELYQVIHGERNHLTSLNLIQRQITTYLNQ